MNNLSTFPVYKGDRNVDIFFVKRTVMLIFSGAYFWGFAGEMWITFVGKCVPPVKTAWKRDDYAIFDGEQMAQIMCIIPEKMWINALVKLCTICGYIVERYAQVDKA